MDSINNNLKQQVELICMDCEYIGKVKLNYDFYNGCDCYSDGDIEDEMLDIVKSNKNYESILSSDETRWPILYHFSPFRVNIIEWYPFEKDANILEIGSDCGAVTKALCQNTFVTCIELSKKRSLINAYRNKDIDNIEIIVGNFNDIKIDNKFDAVTLIGVLEYAKMYTNSANPYIDFLKYIKSFLKDNGKLIIAIENKFGLKYWAGAGEDHTNIVFESIEGYNNNQNVRTFSKMELKDMLKEAGYSNQKFYYPYPDYKLPQIIFSDNILPKINELNINNFNYDNERITLFDEQSVYNELIKNKTFDFFSNSFLVIAS